jgi:hypothetical protein
MEPLVQSVRSSKIEGRHLDRLAIVYVRQSTLRQVMEHLESRERQYDLASHAMALGWSADRVVTIDEDQGRTATTSDRRTGFQRLLAEVTLDHVGVILGLEMSRLARSSKDWHHLLELCALFGTLLGDQDGQPLSVCRSTVLRLRKSYGARSAENVSWAGGRID